MRKHYILPLITFICGLILTLLYASNKNTIDFNIHDTYYVITDALALYFVWLMYIPVALLYLASGKLANTTVGILHLIFKTLALVLLLKINQIDLEGLPPRYYINTSAPWLDLPLVIMLFGIGLVLFVSNILITVVKAYQTKKHQTR